MGPQQNILDVIEVKITANLSSLKQILYYKNSLEYYLLDLTAPEPSYKFTLPRIDMYLIARNFNHEIINLASELKVNLIKLKIKSKTDIELIYMDNSFYKEVSNNHPFVKELKDFYPQLQLK